MTEPTFHESLLYSGTTFHLRCSHPEATLQGLYDAYEPYMDMIIVCQETGKTGLLHFHCLLHKQELHRETIKDILKETYPTVRGNKDYSISLSRNKQQLTKYLLKDGNYKYKGFPSRFIQKMEVLSYSTNEMKRRFQILKDKVTLKEISLSDYMLECINIKVEYEQPLYRNHMSAHFLQIAIKLGDLTPEQLVQQLDPRREF
jgi:hypothetical protein